ncbi:MAG TPA: hypothetical protein VEG30_15505 [Terriglobales bacterium]|nr:hypothetical protein [Terriglobales bacterium]
MLRGNFHRRPAGHARSDERGYILMVLMFMMAALVIGALAVLPRFVQQGQRDREEEMVHRGVQYARAIKRYYKKFGRYPPNLQALEDSNHLRFLRKRYKDPTTEDGNWRLVRYGEVQFNQAAALAGIAASQLALAGQAGAGQNPAQSAFGQSPFGQSSFGQSAFGQSSTSGFGASTFGGSPMGQSSFGQSMFGPSTFGQSSFGQSSFGQSSFGQSSFGQSSFGQSSFGSAGQSALAQLTALAATAQTPAPAPGQLGVTTTASDSTTSGSSFGNSPAVFGGGAIIGVASLSEKESLKVYDEKNHYKDWKFVYDPTFDRGQVSILITGPYSTKIPPIFASQGIGQPIGPGGIGTPAGQSTGSTPGSFGQSGSSGQTGLGNPLTPNMPPTQQ